MEKIRWKQYIVKISVLIRVSSDWGATLSDDPLFPGLQTTYSGWKPEASAA